MGGNLTRFPQFSEFQQIRRKLGLGRFSLGGFSEGGSVFDPAFLEPIVEQIAQWMDDIEPDKRLSELARRPTTVARRVLHALPKMAWASRSSRCFTAIAGQCGTVLPLVQESCKPNDCWRCAKTA